MLTIIIFSIIGLLISIKSNMHHDWRWSWSDIVLDTLIRTIFFAGIGYLAALLIPNDKKVDSWDIELVSMNTVSGLQGNFVLGTGSFGSQSVYVYYRKIGDKEYKQGQVLASKSYIKYSNSKPKLRVWEEELTDHWLNKFSVTLDINLKQEYEFIIPEGSIKEGFKLNY